jgi:hypothetical protein
LNVNEELTTICGVWFRYLRKGSVYIYPFEKSVSLWADTPYLKAALERKGILYNIFSLMKSYEASSGLLSLLCQLSLVDWQYGADRSRCLFF